jgi:dipeptidyl aminopeptidase/acylaminoacyl peptidase
MFSRLSILFTALLLGSFMFVANIQAQGLYKEPSEEIKSILEAPGLPEIRVSPGSDWMMKLHRPNMLDISEISRPRYHLAGYRINPMNNGPSLSRSPLIERIEFEHLESGETVDVEIPEHARIDHVSSAPGGEYLSFSLVTEESYLLYRVNIGEHKPELITDIRLNSVSGRPCSWLNADEMLCRFVPSDRGEEPVNLESSTGPLIQESTDRPTPVRTFQDLLDTPHEKDLFEYYFTSQLKVVNVHNGEATKIGESAIFDQVSPSPDREYLFVSKTVRPFSYIVPDRWRQNDWFARDMEVWDMSGEKVATIANLPLSEEVAVYNNRTGPRDIHWKRGSGSDLIWVELDEQSDRYTEIIFRSAYPYDEKEEIFSLEDNYWSLQWTNNGKAVITEIDRYPYRAASWQRTWVLDSESDADPFLMWDRSVEDRFEDPGSPMGGGNSVRNDGDWIYLRGDGQSPDGARPFIDKINMTNGDTERIWQSGKAYYEYPVNILSEEKIITRKESSQMPPNYMLLDLGTGEERALTHIEDPAPQLRDIERRVLVYEREDGVQLAGTAYLPPGYDWQERLPVVLWAYPREYVSADAAGQVPADDNRFIQFRGYSHLFLLLEGYAIFDGASIAILGGETANDHYVEQLVMSAEAAVNAIVEEGFADPGRIGVGGHSYGGFMTGNLLAHTDLFAAGISRSAAYNRTLTPFGFQNELRTLWEAPEVYMEMSPFMNAHQIEAPLLMIHGQQDPNPGTFPIQSERMFHALKGMGKEARLVMLPYEDHGYGAKQSTYHTLVEMIEWFDRHVKNN